MALDNIPTLGPGGFNGNLDKVLVYKNGGSEVACSLLTLTNSALNPAGLYLDPVNQRMGIGTPNPTNTFELASTSTSPFKVATTASYFRAIFQNSGASGIFDFNASSFQFPTNDVEFGTSSSLGARVGIKGSGSTSATTSLLVQNSGGTTTPLKTTDDGTTSVGWDSTGAFNSVFSANGDVFIGRYGNGLTYVKSSGGVRLNNNNFTFQGRMYVGTGAYTGEEIYLGGPLVASSMVSFNSTTKGFLPPRMTTAQKNLIASPAAGLMVYDTDLNRPCFYSGSAWVTL